MAVTMSDVAALAGVSPRTVSNVVRGYVHVSPETRRRVQEAIDELRYRPNASARSLREGRTGIIALAVPQIAAPYFAELADHIQRFAAARGVTLLIDQTGGSRDRELLVLEGYRSHVIDGLILSPMAATRRDLEDNRLEIPTVLIGERITDAQVVHVGVDNVAGAREATRHLLDTGRRRIAAVGADLGEAGPAAQRLRGFTQAHEDVEVAVPPELVVPTGAVTWERANGYGAVDRLLRTGVEVDALFCFNDVLASAAVRALWDHGLHVPDDVAVVGWDDIGESGYATPSLTTIAPDKLAIARTAVERLLGLVAGQPMHADGVTCGHRLVIRESSTAIRAPRSTARSDAPPARGPA